jgi:hypothetical protein
MKRGDLISAAAGAFAAAVMATGIAYGAAASPDPTERSRVVTTAAAISKSSRQPRATRATPRCPGTSRG